MSDYSFVPTAAGVALEASEKIHGRAVVYTEVGFGSGVNNLNRNRAALVNEEARVPVDGINASSTDERSYVVSCYLPADVGGFEIHEADLFSSDGTLCYIAQYTGAWKPTVTSGLIEDYLVSFEIITSADGVEVSLYVDPNAATASKDDLAVQRAYFEEQLTLDRVAIALNTLKIDQINNPY